MNDDRIAALATTPLDEGLSPRPEAMRLDGFATAGFGRFNAVYGSYFPGNPPARSTVESRLMIDAAIEVEAVAYKPL